MEQIYHKWEWQLSSSPEALWPLVANTDRFNYDLGLPPREDVTGDLPLDNARQKVRFARYGFIEVEFQQEPFEWVRPYKYGFTRLFSKGPTTEITVLVHLNPTSAGGTHLVYEIWVTPRNLIGKWAIQVDLNFISGRKLEDIYHQYDDIAAQNQPQLMESTRQSLPPGAEKRLEQFKKELTQATNQPDLTTKLIELLQTADDLSLGEMRPYVLADYWGADRRTVLELFLMATRIGMLNLQWDLLCPMCRGTQERYTSLSDVSSGVHCPTCNIDFTVNFERSVEITFKPTSVLRDLDDNLNFCISGPYETPHVMLQQLVNPGEERNVEPKLEEGRYRMRTLKKRGNRYLRVDAAHTPEATTMPIPTGEWPTTEREIAPTSPLIIYNDTSDEQLVILERTAWTDQAVTAAEVTTLQKFRDLFANEALRPGEQIAVGSLTVLFTDLQSSTAMYNAMGDAPAFGLVMNHFDLLRRVIDEQQGAIVKTIGDAIMGVFLRPVSAIQAALEAQRLLAEQDPSLVLKVGIHQGACIAVNLNDRLDYFGSTVNMAARLEGLSTGREVIITDAVYEDPEVEELVAQAHIVAERVSVKLKGFDDLDVTIWMISQVDQA